jgi:hypothetical protein
MTVFEHRRREAASLRRTSHPLDPEALVGLANRQKRLTTYAKTGHTVPEKGPMKLPLKATEYIGADPEKAPHIDASMGRV